MLTHPEYLTSSQWLAVTHLKNIENGKLYGKYTVTHLDSAGVTIPSKLRE
jgi:hypothetical protein